MARNRIIKVQFWEDEKVGKLSFGARLLFIGSWNFADDSGVCRANTKYLKSKIFPYNVNLALRSVDGFLTELEGAGLINRVDFNGESYFLIKNFGSHQQINRPSNFQYLKNNDLNSGDSQQKQEGSLTKVKENVNVNVNVKEDAREVDVDNFKSAEKFDEFFKAYPKPKSRLFAENPAWYAYVDTIKNIERHKILMAGLERHKKTEQWQKDDGKFIPNPERFLRDYLWDLPPEEVNKPKKKTVHLACVGCGAFVPMPDDLVEKFKSAGGMCRSCRNKNSTPQAGDREKSIDNFTKNFGKFPGG
jgi:Fe2+ or Zn2+ uptake regulation protein